MQKKRINGEAWTSSQDHSISLLSSHCQDCGQIDFPPLERCPSCWSTDIELKEISKTGTLYSYSIIHQRKKGLPFPYVLGYVDFPEGLRAFGVINVDPSLVAINLQVELCEMTIPENDALLVEMYGFKAVDGEGK